jgi:hypothetical protein
LGKQAYTLLEHNRTFLKGLLNDRQ